MQASGSLSIEGIKEKAMDLWNTTSAYVRFHLAVFTVASAVAFIFWLLGINLLYFLFPNPHSVAHGMQIWRLLTGYYITDGIIILLVSVWMFR